MEDRLEKIESKLALSEDFLEELNKSLYRQQHPIEQLQQELGSLRRQVQSVLPNEQRNSGNEIPPHY